MENVPKQEKLSRKPIDIFVRNIFEYDPSLRDKVVESMRTLVLNGKQMPLVHITSGKIKLTNGEIYDPGMVKNIMENGFKARHTNVAVFVRRGSETSIATPDYFLERPEDFVKCFILFLRRYIHHGYRTNKQILGQKAVNGAGIPVVLVISGGSPMEKGTDYDDHFILKEDEPPEKILGKIDLNESGVLSDGLIDRIINDFLDILSTGNK